jgi:hypothetical protein
MVTAQRRKRLTEGRTVGYAQKQDKRSLFRNAKPLWPLSDLVGDNPGASSVLDGHCRDRIPGQKSPKWRDPGIIPDKSCTNLSRADFDLQAAGEKR